MNGNNVGQRANTIHSLKSDTLDVLVIGGGIVGSGVARDAAMRGLRVAVIDQFDFAFGTSSRSSRLLHGGIRYLAQGKLGLVHQASVEKVTLHKIAPHLAQPLPFVFPCYRGSEWPCWQLKIGVRIYDLLCGGRNFQRSSGMNPRETATLLCGINEQNLIGSARYFDALTNDARLVIDTLRSAAKHGASCLNYVRFNNAQRANDIWTCELQDAPSGEKFIVKARTVVNATGPWANAVPHSHVQLRLTKGIHLVIPKERLPMNEAVVMTEGSRVLFVIPWGERIILGTTDTDYSGSREKVTADTNEAQYVLGVTNQFFPKAKLSTADVISTWAGLRPLIKGGKEGSPSDLSRAHQIRNTEPGWWDVAGGKLTTYRLIAEETVDGFAKERRLKLQRCQTATQPLIDAATNKYSGILPPPFSREAVEHFCHDEWATNLDDVMLRRSSWHYYLTDATAKAQQVAAWMAEILSWTPEQKSAQIAAYSTNACSQHS
jgi:glycerol-3-phosphate dehydrogenase